MSAWKGRDAALLTDPQEVRVTTRRGDGSLRRPTTIWIVAAGDRVFVRSTNGREATWFRGAVATGTGQIESHGVTHDVRFTEVVSEADLAAADAGYRAKYGHYASIVDHLEGPGPRGATLEVTPERGES